MVPGFIPDDEPAQQLLEERFPVLAEAARTAVGRRRFMQLMGAAMALGGLTACSPPPQKYLMPYVHEPEATPRGEPRYYATALAIGGYGRPVLAETRQGRPVKLEGNPRHPYSAGATDIFTQAALLELWDPDRSRAVSRGGHIAAWPDLLEALHERRNRHPDGNGSLHVVTGPLTSPTLRAQLGELMNSGTVYWHHHDPFPRDNLYLGSELAFGRMLETHYRLDRARTVLALDADPLGPGPSQLRHARDFARARSEPTRMARWYCLEATPTLSGARSDHRLPVAASDIPACARALAQLIGLDGVQPAAPDAVPDQWLQMVSRDLQRDRGASLVIVGERQSPEVHALAHRINHRLGNAGRTLAYTRPLISGAGRHGAGLADLDRALAADQVEELVFIDCNPVYDAPPAMALATRLEAVPFSVHLGLYRDETARSCRWHVPMAHDLERWGDCRTADGYASLQQPLINPLYQGRSPLSLVAALTGHYDADERKLVGHFWQREFSDDFDEAWNEALRTGVIENSLPPPVNPGPPAAATPRKTGTAAGTGTASRQGLELVVAPDPTIGDGRFANNPWLQELPKPMLGFTWSNAALVGPALAHRLGLKSNRLVRLHLEDRSLELPVFVVPGQADDTVVVAAGYGREVGAVASGQGANAFRLCPREGGRILGGVTVEPLEAMRELASVQDHHRMPAQAPVRHFDREQWRSGEDLIASETPASLYPPFPPADHAWGMTIDLNACIGCAACTVACQAENNIPTVGEDQVRLGREMHWIRVDHYYEGPEHNPDHLLQPVPCMHCEHAPCEYVCPVEAAVHDSEGLNLQVYNRCVGTRFCANNCPYKVRRFNFLEYSGDLPQQKAVHNPEVTVRQRGVMEKCTYCLQRINAARIQAQLEDRPLRDGDIITACQAACPADAILFGDLNDPDSRIMQARRSNRHYRLLEELNTRPRTTYLADIDNPGRGSGGRDG